MTKTRDRKMQGRGPLDQKAGAEPLSAESLAVVLGAEAEVARDGVRALYDALNGDKRPEVRRVFTQWKGLVSDACGGWLGNRAAAPRKRTVLGPRFARPPATLATDALAAKYGIPAHGLRPAEILFALHTYYALVVKLLVSQVLASAHQSSMPVERLRKAPCGDGLKREIERWEAGGALRALGEALLLDNDPFSWYTAAWNEPIERMMRRLADGFDRYDPKTLQGDPSEGRDLLKGLYASLFPKPVRRALGEFYTPDWLARHVLDEAGFQGEPNARLLDPACGSGTFLVEAIRRIRSSHKADLRGDDITRGLSRFSRMEKGTVPLPNPERASLCRKILASVVGYDLNPLAVLSARANYLIAICDLLGDVGPVEIPVRLRDSILTWGREKVSGTFCAKHPSGLRKGVRNLLCEAPFGPFRQKVPDTFSQPFSQPDGKFDYVVGNPPWINWDDLPEDYREQTKPLWQRYGLFSLSGSDARHGGAKKDLAMLMLYVAADRYLRTGGRLAMVVTQTLFQTKGAGDGFRRFRLGSDGPWLRVLRVSDLVDIRPFPGAANWTATLVLEKGGPTVYPVPYVKWSLKKDEGGRMEDERGEPAHLRSSLILHPSSLVSRPYLAEPIDPARPTSPWLVRPEGLTTDWARLVGPSDYRAHLGANSGGANGVYWVHVLEKADGGVLVRNMPGRGKRSVASVEQVIEPDLVYPLLRWADVARYRAVPSAHLLLVQDLQTRRGIDEPILRDRYPKTHSYLERFAPALRDRAAYKRYQRHAAFYSMYNVGKYTAAPVKVVWRRMDRCVNAAVVEPLEDPILGVRAVVPQETCVLLTAASSDEAHYLSAVLNSAIVGFLVTSHSVRGGKGFGSPGMLDFIRLRRFEPGAPLHHELAAASRRAHQALQRGEPIREIQREIDRLAGRLWGLTQSELEALDRA